MLGVIGQVLPEAVGILLSPFPIIGLILILFTKQAAHQQPDVYDRVAAGTDCGCIYCAGAGERGKNYGGRR